MESNPLTRTQQNRVKPEFSSRENTSYRRDILNEKTTPLHPEKDSSQLWNLSKVLNEEAPSRSGTVFRVHNELLTDQKSANEFAQIYRMENSLPLTSNTLGYMKQKLKEEEKQENITNTCMNSTLKMPELNSAVRNLKPKKPPGVDGVSNDMLQHLGQIARKTLLQIFNRTWSKGLLPGVWKTAHPVQGLKRERTRPTQAAIVPCHQLTPLS